jgi:hypothetical protein
MSTPPAAANDADLDDLLQDNHHGGIPPQQRHLEMTPLNLDHLTKGQLDVTSKPTRTSDTTAGGGFCALLQASCTYIAYVHPFLCSACALLSIALLLFTLFNTIMNPTLEYGNVFEDFSSVKSQFDLSQGKIDHWCLRGDNDSCRCEDPLVPASRAEFQTWTRAHRANKELLKEQTTVKVAFVGESLVEEMHGRWMGQSKGPQLETMRAMFEQKFSKDNGIEAVALGIAGDTVSTM